MAFGSFPTVDLLRTLNDEKNSMDDENDLDRRWFCRSLPFP